jgi:peptidoglycan/xylan/chitin deacetylase (PgdA/CDA1 family)
MQRKLRILLKHVIYFIAFYSGLLSILVVLFKKIKKKHSGIILFYHRFCEARKEENLLPHLDIEEFKKQILYLKGRYAFVSINELSNTIKQKGTFEVPSIVLTIDDGYLNNYLLAYPILRDHRIPAIIYLTAGTIGTASGLWIDDIDYALMHSGVQTFCLRESFGNESFDISTFQSKKRLEKLLFSALLRQDNAQRQRLMQGIFDALEVDPSNLNGRPRLIINWSEIKEMSENDISFGAHTLTHPCLPALPIETAEYEIKHSKEIIEKQLAKTVQHFAIPNGEKEDFTEELRAYCREIGFDTVATTESGVVDSTADRFSLKRVIPPPPMYYFACEIAKYFFYNRSKHNLEK